MIKNTIKISEADETVDTVTYWMNKTPEERVEAVETIREHYYSMLGYDTPPRIKKIIKIS